MRCGLAYANPRLDEDEITELYTKSYRDIDDVPEDHLRLKEQQSVERIEWLIRHYPSGPSRVLEIGCSEGVLLRRLRDNCEWSVAGVEPFEPYARHGIDNWNLDIEVSFFESERFSKEFDLVAFMHVIEHVPNPVSFLAEVSKVLKEGGYIFFETPNLWEPKIGRISAALFAAPHLAIFSPKSINLLLQKVGFELVHLEADNNLRVLARWAGASSLEHTRATNPINLFHVMRMAFLYRYWWLLEKSLFKKRNVEAFLVQNAKRLLGPKKYKRFRNLYRGYTAKLP